MKTLAQKTERGSFCGVLFCREYSMPYAFGSSKEMDVVSCILGYAQRAERSHLTVRCQRNYVNLHPCVTSVCGNEEHRNPVPLVYWLLDVVGKSSSHDELAQNSLSMISTASLRLGKVLSEPRLLLL